MLDLILKIVKKLEKEPTSYRIHYDLYQIAREVMKTNRDEGLKWLKVVSQRCNDIIPALAKTDLNIARNFGLNIQEPRNSFR